MGFAYYSARLGLSSIHSFSACIRLIHSFRACIPFCLRNFVFATPPLEFDSAFRLYRTAVLSLLLFPLVSLVCLRDSVRNCVRWPLLMTHTVGRS